MVSSTKNTISEKEIKSMISNAANSNALPIKNYNLISYREIDTGYFNNIYILFFKETEIILKVSPININSILRYEKNIINAEIEALNLVGKYTKVPVPCVYFHDIKQDDCIYKYFFMQKIDGIEFNSLIPKLSDEEIYNIEYSLGQYNKDINNIHNEKFGYLAQKEKQESKWSVAFFNIVSDILIDGSEANIELPYERIKNIVTMFSNVLDEVISPRLVHWDLWPGNLLIKDRQISGIIDFERAIWGDPLMEYYFSNSVNNKYFCSGYGIDFDKLDKNSKIRRHLYDLYLYLVQKIECYYRGYVNSPQNSFAEKCIYQELEKLENF